MMDEDGFVYFKGRLKRMIISSGYCVYPNNNMSAPHIPPNEKAIA